MQRSYSVYIMTNWDGRVLYVGVTNNLERRVCEHKNKLVEGFTKKYNLTKLVYSESFSSASEAIATEKKIKGWTRGKKEDLIDSKNPGWKDLNA